MSRLRIVPARAGEAGAARQEVLLPYLERLCFNGGRLSTSATELRLGFSLELLELDAWDRSVLEAAAVSQEGQPSYSALMAEGVAFQAKCMMQRQRAAQGAVASEQDRSTLGNELIVDAAVGIALMEELQRDVNQLIADGELEEAKRLTAFRHKLGRSVQHLKETLGEPAFQVAQEKSDKMVSEVSKVTSEAGSDIPAWAKRASPSPETEREQSARSRNGAVRRPAKHKAPAIAKAMSRGKQAESQVSSRRLGMMVGLLAALIAVWAVVILPTKLGPAPPPLLSSSDFSGVTGITSVQPRPPSLFVTVDIDTWNALSREDRMAQVEQIGAIAEQAEYTGVHITDTDGAANGSWTLKRGARLLDSVEGR